MRYLLARKPDFYHVASSVTSVSNGFEIFRVSITGYSDFGTYLLLIFLGKTMIWSQLKNDKSFEN